ncbi:flagellar assembly protein J [archaeon BMS3Bbin16]|nr:flagellar assembly protein J [archaeon BMS3Bbin16]
MARITIPRRIVPKKLLRSVEVSLANAGMPFSGLEWISIWLIISTVLFGLAAFIFNIFIGLAAFIVGLAAMVMIPTMRADKRKAMIEDSLPDALHHMAVAVRTGLVLESVIQEISEAEYGPLSEEFARITLEIRKGRPLKEALLAFAKRTRSKDVQRIMRLILEGVEAGGPIADVLDEVSDNMRAIKMIKRERKSATAQQISFLAMASLFAGPFVMGVVGGLPNVMEAVAGGMADIPLTEIQGVISALRFYVFAQAVAAGMMMGVTMYGDFKKGFKFAIPMGIFALAVYSIVQKIMPKMVTMF